MSCRDTSSECDDRAWLVWLHPVLAAASSSPELNRHIGSTSAPISIVYRLKRDGGDVQTLRHLAAAVHSAQATANAENATQISVCPFIVAVRYSAGSSTSAEQEPSSEDAVQSSTSSTSADTSSGFCGFITTFPWQTGPSDVTFGELQSCFAFKFDRQVEGSAKIWQGEEQDTYHDEDDPGFQPVCAVRLSAIQGLILGGSPSGAALTLSADLKQATSRKSGFFGNDPLGPGPANEPLGPGPAPTGAAGNTKSSAKLKLKHVGGSFDIVDVALIAVGDVPGGEGGSRPSMFAEEGDSGPTALQENQDTFMLNFISSSVRNNAINRNYFG